MDNSLFIIEPYWSMGTWVFDDPAANLVREPFVDGMPEMINRLVEHIPDARNGFRMIFSMKPFPGAQHQLRHLREESEGHWYRDDALALEGWLCPAMFKYFHAAPPRIFVRAEPKMTNNGGAQGE